MLRRSLPWRRFVERARGAIVRRVLVFEDLHWADDALLDFIEHLVTWAAPVPLVLLCTARPELLARRPHWGADGDSSVVVPLEPMSAGETEQLLDALLGDARLTSETRSTLLVRAEGNPLYAQEFVQMLSDQGLLVERDGEWVLERTTAMPVPDSIVGIIAARLDAMPAPDRHSRPGRCGGRPAVLAGRGRVRRRAATRWRSSRRSVRRSSSRNLVPSPDTSRRSTGRREYAFEHALDPRRRLPLDRPHAAGGASIVARPNGSSSFTGDPRDRADTIAHHYVTALENAERLPASFRPSCVSLRPKRS